VKQIDKTTARALLTFMEWSLSEPVQAFLEQEALRSMRLGREPLSFPDSESETFRRLASAVLEGRSDDAIAILRAHFG
jgi:hypothetical protein